MATVYNKPISRLEAFERLFVRSKMEQHKDNKDWRTYEYSRHLCGGRDAIFDVWCLFQQVMSEAQKRIMGFDDADVDAIVEQSRENPMVLL